MSKATKPLLWALIAAGGVISLVVALTTSGLPYDVQSWEIVRSGFGAHPLHVYALANASGQFHWPYPPGFFPLMVVVTGLSDLVGGDFTHLIRIPAILADSAIAWLVWLGLEHRVSERTRLVAAALVAVGPVFVTVAGYAAQIDPVAILPAVGALLVWERDRPGRRALLAGLLIGIAAAIKTVPLVMLIALAPSARSVRELNTLVGAALAVLVVALLPWLAADLNGVANIRHYNGSPGMGGLSLVMQPDLAERWLTSWVTATPLERFLFVDHAGPYNAVVLAGTVAYAWRFRPSPRVGSAVVWLIVLAFGSGFFFQYLVWALPFLLLAGYVTAAAALQAVVTVPMVIYYAGPWHHRAIVYVYVPFMLVVWVAWVALAVVLARRTGTPWRRAAVA